MDRRHSNSITAIIDAGVVAANLEDSDGDHARPLVGADAHAHSISRARDAAERTGQRFFINARSDIFLAQPAFPERDAVEEAIRRARLYVSAGADGIYLPARNLSDAVLAELVAAIPAPLTVLAPSRPFGHWREIGIRRVSLGTAVIRSAYAAIQGQLAAARSGLDIAPVPDIEGALRLSRVGRDAPVSPLPQ